MINYLFCIFIFLFSSHNVVYAKNRIDIKSYQEIKKQFTEQKYQLIIDEYKAKKIDNNDYRSLLLVAISFRDTGSIDKSIQMLAELLKISDSAFRERVLAELAGAYYLKENYILSFKICTRLTMVSKNEQIIKFCEDLKKLIKTESGNENTLKKIEEEMTKDAKNSKIFYGAFDFSYMFDSNPNLSTAASQIYLYGIPFAHHQLGSDSGFNVGGNIGYNYKLTDNIGAFGNIAVNTTEYTKYYNRDLLFLSVFQGLSFNYKKSTFSVVGLYNSMYLGAENMIEWNNYYMSMYSIMPSFTYDFGSIKSQSYYRYINKDAKGFPDRNSNMHMFMQSFSFFLTKLTMFNIGLGGGFELTANRVYDNNIYMFNVLLRQSLPYNIPVYLDIAYNLSTITYRHYDPLLQVTRHDFYNVFRFAVHYLRQIFFTKVDFYISYAFSRNYSNTSLYTFDRHQFIAGVKFMF